jgi:putative hemolysin
MIDIEYIASEKISGYPSFFKKPVLKTLKKLIRQDEINEFLQQTSHLGTFEFIEEILEYFNFTYKISNNETENIPKTGRTIIIANHPQGALDSLCLIHLVSKIRKDIKITANTFLSSIPQLKPLLIEIDPFNNKIPKNSVKEIDKALKNEEVVIFFPAGEVSRITPSGIKDGKWYQGFLKFSFKNRSPILPIYIKSKNSALFYGTSYINKTFSSLLLPNEMFMQKNKSLEFKIGELIPFENFSRLNIDKKTLVKLFKKHLYKLPKNKQVFQTQKCIAHPEEKGEIKKELKNSEFLGETADGKKIYLYQNSDESVILKEIGRLRELTFRKVKEGTGKKRDLDRYDKYYKHIILWDDENLEIIGSYRIGTGAEIYEQYGIKGFYSNTLFDFSRRFEKLLPFSIELGRSFVQPKYWGSRALDCLWQGIGKYLKNNPQIKYMFGPVSISSAMPKTAQNLIIYYHDLYYGNKDALVKAKNPFILKKREIDEMEEIFCGYDRNKDFFILKEQLKEYNISIPTLYKHYTGLCENHGVQFLGYNIDKYFNDCIDSMILVEIDKINEKKKKRYFS